MNKKQYRIIKIEKKALFEFIYEKFVENQDDYLDVNPEEVMNNFDIDFEKGTFIFMAQKFDDDNGNITPFSEKIDVKKLLNKMDETTDSMFSNNKRYKDFSLNELIEIQEKI